ncbi:MAG: hypothetical protein E4H14_06745 [Candidatus Thorarchaeota archaeon]|nr:MAG: hypothetical protein E4H14_06745 [Candidatus Thorarchaeota archaeon]
MLELIITKISAVFAAIPFSTATWMVLGILMLLVWLFSKAHRNPDSRVDWEDLILDHDTDRVSPYKVGYLIGVIIGTWIIIRLSDADKLTWDILSGYFLYLLGGAGTSMMTADKKPKPAITPIPAAPAPKVDDVVK